MNLYKLHTNPEKLYGWDRRIRIPEFAYEAALERYKKQGSDLQIWNPQSLQIQYGLIGMLAMSSRADGWI